MVILRLRQVRGRLPLERSHGSVIVQPVLNDRFERLLRVCAMDEISRIDDEIRILVRDLLNESPGARIIVIVGRLAKSQLQVCNVEKANHPV